MPPKRPIIPHGYGENPTYNFTPENGVRLTLGMLGTGVSALVVGTVSIVSFGFSWSSKIDRMSEQIEALTKIVWTVPDAREMAHKIRRDNPTLVWPDPAEIHHTIHGTK